MLVEEKMNETAERELERCGMGMAAAAKFYQADNNYDVYWQGEHRMSSLANEMALNRFADWWEIEPMRVTECAY